MFIFNYKLFKAIRCARGLTQKELAEKAGVDIALIKEIENGAKGDIHGAVAVTLAAELTVHPMTFYCKSIEQYKEKYYDIYGKGK